MTDRGWQRVAVGAIAVTVLGGFLPLWPSAVRVAALAAGVVLAVMAVVLRHRLRRQQLNQQREQPRDWAGGNDEPFHRQAETNPDLVPRSDQRWSGLFGG